MTQPSKKPSPAQPAAKLASNIAKNSYAAVDSTRNSAENVVKIGSNAVRELIASSADEAQKAQEKVFSMGRESAENFVKSADAVTKALHEAIDMSRENIETALECGNMTASFAKDVSSEAFESANRAFSDQVEISKEFFACRTLNDIFELQNRLVKQSIDNFFNQSVKLSGMAFEYTTEALEPINERIAKATDQFNRSLAA